MPEMNETVISYIFLVTSIITIVLFLYTNHKVNMLTNSINQSKTKLNKNSLKGYLDTIDDHITTIQEKLKKPFKILIAASVVGVVLIPPMSLAVDKYNLTSNQYFNITMLLLTLPILFYAIYILGILPSYKLQSATIITIIYIVLYFYNKSPNGFHAALLVFVSGYVISYLIVKTSIFIFDWINQSLPAQVSLQSNLQALVKLLSLALTAIILYELIKLGVKLG